MSQSCRCSRATGRPAVSFGQISCSWRQSSRCSSIGFASKCRVQRKSRDDRAGGPIEAAQHRMCCKAVPSGFSVREGSPAGTLSPKKPVLGYPLLCRVADEPAPNLSPARPAPTSPPAPTPQPDRDHSKGVSRPKCKSGVAKANILHYDTPVTS